MQNNNIKFYQILLTIILYYVIFIIENLRTAQPKGVKNNDKVHHHRRIKRQGHQETKTFYQILL